jgi:hypothetical protein
LNFVLNHALDKYFTINVFILLIFNCQYGRQTTPTDKIKEAHRRVMVANHPDAGGSHYLASKINEAKDMLVGKTKGSGSAF